MSEFHADLITATQANTARGLDYKHQACLQIILEKDFASSGTELQQLIP